MKKKNASARSTWSTLALNQYLFRIFLPHCVDLHLHIKRNKGKRCTSLMTYVPIGSLISAFVRGSTLFLNIRVSLPLTEILNLFSQLQRARMWMTWIRNSSANYLMLSSGMLPRTSEVILDWTLERTTWASPLSICLATPNLYDFHMKSVLQTGHN